MWLFNELRDPGRDTLFCIGCRRVSLIEAGSKYLSNWIKRGHCVGTLGIRAELGKVRKSVGRVRSQDFKQRSTAGPARKTGGNNA
jgi:hypothetical protein